MKIQSVSPAPARGAQAAGLRSLDGSISSRATPVFVNLAPIHITVNATPPPAEAKKKEDGSLANLLSKGTALGTVFSGSTVLISGVHKATPQQLAGMMHQYHLTSSPAAGLDQAKSILDAVQSKAGSSVLFGACAGVATYSVVEVVAPQASLRTRLIVALGVAALVFSGLYFGIQEKPAGTPKAPASTTQP